MLLQVTWALLILLASIALPALGIHPRARAPEAEVSLKLERPSVALATLGDPALGGKDRLLAEASIANKRNYVKALGQDSSTALMESGANFPQPEGWGGGWKKVDFLVSMFNLTKSDWLMWVDLDIFITRDDYDVRDLLDDNVDVVMGPVGAGNYETCVRELNTGLFFVRRTPAGLNMLNRAKDLRQKLGWESQHRMEQAFLLGAAAQLAAEGQLRVKMFSTSEMQALPFQWTPDHFAVHLAFHEMLPCCAWSETPTPEVNLNNTLGALAAGRYPDGGYSALALWRLHCAAIQNPSAVENTTWTELSRPQAAKGPHPGGASFNLVIGQGVWGQIKDLLVSNLGEIDQLFPKGVLSETRRTKTLLPGEPLITFMANEYSD